MSQKDDSESDIWEYKPLEKKIKKESQSVTKRRCTVRKTSKKETSLSVKSFQKSKQAKPAESGDCSKSKLESNNASSKEAIRKAAERSSLSEDYCPICQMPFFLLVVQSQRWHVAECLDVSRDTCKECPEGLQCSSTIPNHYKKFNHTLLAHSRANSSTDVLGLPPQAETSSEASFSSLPGLTDKEVDRCTLDASQSRALSLSSLSNQSVSPGKEDAGSPLLKRTNSLLLLRSPAPDDLRKRKGWLVSNKGQKSAAASQSKADISSTPVKEATTSHACEHTEETFPENDVKISYSPLSELPAETEASSDCRKALFDHDKSDDEDSVLLFNDSFSDDEVLADFVDNLEDDGMTLKDPSSRAQLGSVSSLSPANQVSIVPTGRAEPEACCGSPFQSPQSFVLEHLRETLLSSQGQCSQNSNDTIQPEKRGAAPQVSSSQQSSARGAQSMPPHKGHSKAGQASGLRQTDIGVFFGLKPLKEEKNETESGPNELNVASVPTTRRNSGQKGQRAGRQGESSTADSSRSTETGDDLSLMSGQGNSGRGGRRGWRRGWTRRNPDGEVQLRRCPFYKKIPGTKFAIDAFCYGEVEGITAYFLTHFHSDHYGGLTKSSTFPIYCNKITGNLVRSKLRVAEQYVHILPMNTEVSVEGVRVILLDANHCPGAAMLLFRLPDGQTVLHTGDFRADPSMEAYPELLSCRVQTLYLDTTYCSPEYTFPTQQEVVNFAASTAFELVTFNPRTLVVCGSYSVGKEKVFLALAEVLGSKVCLSKDKYNTMRCLESEQIKKQITTDWKAAQVHVLPMMQLSFKKLQDHLARFSSQYDQLVAFKPTGWTFSKQAASVGDIQPEISGNVSVYGIPYSEHSSFLELKRFVQWLQPLKIIPTVNVGCWSSRKAMEECFSAWLTESKAKL